MRLLFWTQAFSAVDNKQNRDSRKVGGAAYLHYWQGVRRTPDFRRMCTSRNEERRQTDALRRSV